MGIRYLKPGQDFQFDRDFGFTGSAAGRNDARNHPEDADDDEYGDGSYVENPPKLAKEKGLAKGGRATGKPSSAHANDPQGYAMGGPADGMPTGRPTGVPMGNAAPPGVGPAAGPMAQAPASMGARPSPLAQGGGDQSSPFSDATISMPVHSAQRLAHGLVQTGRVAGIRQAIGNAAAARGAAAARSAAMSPGAAGSPAAAPPAAVQQQGIPQMKEGGHFIQGMHMKRGALHRQLGVAEGHKIPEAKLEKAAHSSNPLLARRARTAEMLKSLPHGKK